MKLIDIVETQMCPHCHFDIINADGISFVACSWVPDIKLSFPNGYVQWFDPCTLEDWAKYPLNPLKHRPIGRK